MNQLYPGVSERVKAVLVDTIMMTLLIFGIIYLFGLFAEVSGFFRIGAFLFVILLYDPLFTSFFGGTLGHMFLGIKVKRVNNEEKNILFPLALVRFIVKASLGWISLITVSTTDQKRAIHDMIVGSIVLYAEEPDE